MGRQITNESMRAYLSDLHHRVIDELEVRYFLAIPTEFVDYYRQPRPLFGVGVESAFPSMAEDISEVGRCLASNRATAAVFSSK
jgi:hypothetical protein